MKVRNKRVTRLDISRFIEDECLCLGSLLVSIKNVDGRQLRNALSQSGVSGRSWGRDVRKDPTDENGLITLVRLREGGVTCETVVSGLYGPRGMEVDEDRIFVATTNSIRVFDKEFRQIMVLTDKYCHWIHALKVVRDANRKFLIASSSRLGTIITFSLDTGKVVDRWIGWENGFNISLDGTIVSNKQFGGIKTIDDGSHIYIDKDSPEKSLDLLTTPKQVFRCTGIDMGIDGELFVSLFSGELVVIKNFLNFKKVRKPIVLMRCNTNLHSPILINKNGQVRIMVTNTMAGEVLEVDLSGDSMCVLDFSGLISENEGKMWLQGCKVINGMVVALDGTKNQFILVDLVNQRRRRLLFPNQDWAIHDFVENCE